MIRTHAGSTDKKRRKKEGKYEEKRKKKKKKKKKEKVRRRERERGVSLSVEERRKKKEEEKVPRTISQAFHCADVPRPNGTVLSGALAAWDVSAGVHADAGAGLPGCWCSSARCFEHGRGAT